MLTKQFSEAIRPSDVYPNCDYCGGEDAEITMLGYGDDGPGNCHWCVECALQLVRKIMEDVCELRTKAGRHG
jgi:hypothetical protein